MVLQDKTKYGAPKYRLVVRRTCSDIIAQVVHATVQGDKVLQAAYSHELPLFGITKGLTNYAAAYATGLLVARRTLTKLGIADKFAGAKETNGAYEAARTKKDDESGSEDRFPFKAILDVGLARTTTGARLFGVLKGAVDGGIAIPHKPNRFPGFNRTKKELDAKIHRERIFGIHVSKYLKDIITEKKENPDDKLNQFATFEKAGIKPETMEKMYKDAHAAIRKEPLKAKPKKAAKAGAVSKKYNKKRLTKKERRANAKKKVETLRKRLGK